MSRPILPARVPDQSGRTWLVTGATNGIGRQVAMAASAAGAALVVPARNVPAAQALAAQLPGPAHVVPLDLADLASVRAAAERVEGPIDVLVNNAGAVSTRRLENAAGHELLLATNLYGPFALTNLLLDRVRERVVIVGSNAHRVGRVDLADPHFRHRRWSQASAYAQSKLGDMLWGVELDARLRAAGRAGGPGASEGITVQLAHPGWALTNLQNVTSSPRFNAAVTAAFQPFAQSAQAGALPVLVAATTQLPPVSYVGPDGVGGQRGAPMLAGRAWRAVDPQTARDVWALCARETGTDL